MAKYLQNISKLLIFAFGNKETTNPILVFAVQVAMWKSGFWTSNIRTRI